MFKKAKYLILPLVALFLFTNAKPVQAFYLEVPTFVKKAFEALKIDVSKADETSTETMTPGLPPKVEPMYESEKYELERKEFPSSQVMPYNDEQNKMQSPTNNNMNFGSNQDPNNGGQKGDSERHLKDVQRGTKQMERNLKKFEDLVIKAEKEGTIISDDIKQKISKLKSLLERAASAKTGDDLQDFDMGEANDLMQELEQSRQDVFEKAQRLKDVKKQMKGPESGIKSFEKQLVKAGTCASEEVKMKVKKLRDSIDTIKKATTWDEVESGGLDDLGEQFSDMDDIRQQLEVCARWPQTLKQINREVSNLQKNLKRAKTAVTRLSTKGVDLSSAYSSFESAVLKLKGVRDSAVEKMQSGASQEAFELLQDDFFGQMDDAMQYMQVIDMMSNLGKFNSDFKREMTKSEQQIRALQKKKIDVSELKTLLEEAKIKGGEISKIIKSKDADLELVMEMIQDLEEIGGSFDNKMEELTGGSDDMPWETGPQQLKSIEMPSGLNKYIKQQAPSVSIPK